MPDDNKLDNLIKIDEVDNSRALDVTEKQHEQLLHEFDQNIIFADIDSVVVAGMGGSALSANILKSWLGPRLKLPLEIVRDYNLPGFVNSKTLFIASSYSGNTEETVSALIEAEHKNAKIITISSGGKLQELSGSKGYPHLELPPNLQPRHAVFYSLRALAEIFDHLKLSVNAVEELIKASEFLKTESKEWSKTTPTASNLAKQIALKLEGTSPVIYGGPLMRAAAYKWKIDLNENAKNTAFWNEYSEFNHNEFIGWTGKPDQKPFSVVELRSNLEPAQVNKRYVISDELLKGSMPDPIVIKANGHGRIQQLLWAITLGDFTSMYLAILNEIDPMPVDLIEQLKNRLG